MRLRDRVGIVTGGGQGMGAAVARMWAAEGAAVVITDLESRGKSVASEICASGGDAVFVQADVASVDDWDRVMATTIERHGRIDALHNNAGYHAFFDPLKDEIALWDRLIDVNLKGVFLGCRAVLPFLIEQRRGAIVNSSSTSALQGYPLHSAYGAAKAGVIQLTRALANAYGGDGVRVNAICPGNVDTPMFREAAGQVEGYLAGTVAGGFEHELITQNPAVALARRGSPEEVANVVTFLVSDDSSWITGTWLPVDGGKTA